MLILRTNKFLQSLIGLKASNRRVGYHIVVIYTLSMLSTLLPSIAYLIMNIDDLNIASDSMYGICAYLIILSKYWHIANIHKVFYAMLDDLQNIVNESKYRTLMQT